MQEKENNKHVFNVAGVTFDNLQEILKNLTGDRIASFELEPENKYDSTAIKVMIEGFHVGYIKKEDKSLISDMNSTVNAYVGSYNNNFYVTF